MLSGPFIDRHHFVPKCEGGKESEFLHKVCHRKIHSLWTEKELAREFNDPNKIKEHPEMQKFLTFIRKKEPNFCDRNESHNRKKRKK